VVKSRLLDVVLMKDLTTLQRRFSSVKAAVTLILTAALVAGCGGDEKTKTVTVTKEAETPAPPQEGNASTATPTPTASGDGEGASNGIVTGEGSYDGDRFRFVLTELKRSGSTVVVGARLEMLDGDENASLQVSGVFDDGQYQKLADGKSEGGDVADGFALIDPQGRKKYLVARDETGRCVCSNGLSGLFLYMGKPVTVQATLSAPPPTVSRVNVQVPNVKTFTDVPISG
jgi:hypothetical protein